jgi:ABC-2 type transport system permease protein
MQVGLFAFLIEDVAPLRWIVHKMRMLFGGNILPIALMPLWLQTVAFASPFAYTGYTAGLTFARFDPATFARYFLMQCFWISVLMASIALSYSYFSRRLAVNGG